MLGCRQVIDQLRFMGSDQLFHGFDFHNDPAVDKDVGIKNAGLDSVIGHMDWRFAFRQQPVFMQFMRQGLLINRLQKSMAERSMNLHGATNDPMRQLIVLHRQSLLGL